MTPAARIVVLVLAALALLAGGPAPVAAGPAGVRNAWVRLPPPGTPAAAYLTLHNRTDQGLTLVGATSPDCQRVEIHRSVVEDGMARMEPAGPLEIPPEGTLVFAPRGLHLMLMQPKELEAGKRVELKLELEGGATIDVEATVRRGAPRTRHTLH